MSLTKPYVSFVFFCVLFLPLTAFSQDDGWQFEVTPFFWGIAFNGTSSVNNLPALDIDMGIDEMFDHFNGGVAAFGVVKKGKWSLFLESTYLSLEKTKDIADVEFSQNFKTFLFMNAVAYRLPTPVEIDLYGGARVMVLNLSNERNDEETLDATQSWVDPIVGMHISLPFTEKFGFDFHADMGGFGAGSEFTYMVMPVFSYEFSSLISGKLAYRWLDVDYDKDDFAMDMLISGPMLGVTFKW
ncbi:MAG: hypothetical protein KAR01_01625 [Desulfocapsa sp.]|nr:hypothetical protein [Desulfocapsa sp.]